MADCIIVFLVSVIGPSRTDLHNNATQDTKIKSISTDVFKSATFVIIAHDDIFTKHQYHHRRYEQLNFQVSRVHSFCFSIFNFQYLANDCHLGITKNSD